MSFELIRSLYAVKAQYPLAIQMQYLANSKREKTFKYTSPFTGSKYKALWNTNQDLREMIAAFVRNKWHGIELGRPEVIVDLGSNNGYSALYFADRFPEATIYLIDLLQENTLFGSRLFSLNNKKAIHVCAAVSNEDGFLDVDLHPAHSRNRLSNLLDESQRAQFGFSNETIRVGSSRLKTLIDKLGIDTIDLLKVDIEGAEQYLLEDVSDWQPYVRAILMEVHHNVDIEDAERRLKNAGYSVDKTMSDWLMKR